jgi:hypothetical protein
MTAATEIAAVRHLPAASDWAISPKRDTLVSQAEVIPTASDGLWNQISLPIFVLGLGVGLAAITIVTIVT